jgi:hypothetical protein
MLATTLCGFDRQGRKQDCAPEHACGRHQSLCKAYSVADKSKVRHTLMPAFSHGLGNKLAGRPRFQTNPAHCTFSIRTHRLFPRLEHTLRECFRQTECHFQTRDHANKRRRVQHRLCSRGFSSSKIWRTRILSKCIYSPKRRTRAKKWTVIRIRSQNRKLAKVRRCGAALRPKKKRYFSLKLDLISKKYL